MKKLIILFMILSTLVTAQQSQRSLTNTHNDKYMDKYSYQNNNEIIVCESRNSQRSHCHVNTQYGVNFVRQLSRSSCDYNWGYDDEGIWVENGCRAEFSLNLGWDQPGAESNVIVCESHDYARSYCHAYLGGRDVFLVRQLSSSTCLNNWGYDQNGVWVTYGCRAEFVVEDKYISHGDYLICSSRNLNFQACQANTQGGVQFIRQLSSASCNGNWGYDNLGIWVTNGCRAKFKIIPYIQPIYPQTITCSSRNLARKVCRADTSGGVRLKTQKSNANCRGNWGYRHNEIWVENGCRAVFQLNINNSNNGNNNHNDGYNYNDHINHSDRENGYNNSQNNNYNNNYNTNQHQYLLCESINLVKKTCPIPRGSKVKFHKQKSRTSCIGNWGSNHNGVWVVNGCRAEFNVY